MKRPFHSALVVAPLLGLALQGCGSDDSPPFVASSSQGTSTVTSVATTSTTGSASTTTAVTATRYYIGPSEQLTLTPGAQQQLGFFAALSNGSTVDLTEQASWSSSDPDRLAVSNGSGSRGRVTAAPTGAAGSLVVVASYHGFSATAEVTVSGTPLRSLLESAAPTVVPAGFPVRLAVVGSYEDGSSASLSSVATYSVADPSRVSVASDGTLTALAPGQTTVTARIGALSRVYTVRTVNATLQSVDLTPYSAGRGGHSLPVAQPQLPLGPGDTEEMTAYGRFSDGSVVDVTSAASFSSDHPEVARVAGGSLIASVGTGTAMVTASIPVSVANAAPVTATRDFLVDSKAHYTEQQVPFTYRDISISGEPVADLTSAPADFLFAFLAGTIPVSGWEVDSSSYIGNSVGSLALFEDLNSFAYGSVYQQILGTAPNRQLILQWNGGPYNGTGGRDGQAVFFEGSNQIEFRYRRIDPEGGVGATLSASVGVDTDSLSLIHTAYGPFLSNTAFRFTP